LRGWLTWSAEQFRGVSEMPAQQRDARKNYIGIVSDMVAEQRAVASAPKSNHVVKDFLAAVRAVLNRRHETRN
jgi:hypothetical protein